MYNPVSTYRIQFHKGFTFDNLEAIIPYLEQLGIGTLYASPIFKAVPGSMHGYDGVDPLQINPEIGTLGQLRKISTLLKTKGIGWIQDIVPNHMAFHSDNAWLMDVLEKGPLSKYFNFFDINTDNSPLMVPFLGSDLTKVIENGELKIIWQNAKFQFDYAGNIWPLATTSYADILNTSSSNVPQGLTEDLAGLAQLETIKEPDAFAIETNKLSQKLNSLFKENVAKKWLTQTLEKVNRDGNLLTKLAGQQYYRLCCWQETDHHINYRRFFTVNGLICLNIQRPEVFNEFHQLVGQLVKEEIFDGLRVDHIDGLFDPQKYLQQLRRLAGPDTFISVEKILEPGEAMPANWTVEGNTGYDFLALVNNLLTGREGEGQLSAFYKEMTGKQASVSKQVAVKKRNILTKYMAGEWENLTRLFIKLDLANTKDLANVANNDLKLAIGEFLIACPVYRFYGDSLPLNISESKSIKRLLKNVKKENTGLEPAIALLERAFLALSEKENAYNKRALSFYQRCMQFTGPLMAKGVEDTLMYTDNHFIAHNEVGDSPEASGLSVKEFHKLMIDRQQNWPLGMNGTATHDTKRGEDVRARLQVLPDVADEWLKLVNSWQKTTPGNINQNDAYFVYQTLLGAYPMPGEKSDDFLDRLNQYFEKTLREGKESSSWAEPDLTYEAAVKAFAKDLLKKNKPFWKAFDPFYRKVADFGIVNSLAQVLLKFTCPGVPDIYQGCEHWDLSLVDPDNRRPVDYDLRQNLLSDLLKGKSEDSLKQLWNERLNGQIKIWLTHLLAVERKKQPDLFQNGAYLPLKVKGKYKDHIIAFARQFKSTWYIVVAQLGLGKLVDNLSDVNSFDWENTIIELPDNVPARAQNLIENTTLKTSEKIKVSSLFGTVPLAFLKLSSPENKRGAGILMPLASLPSSFGMGDFGKDARRFADTLNRCGQKYWQLLPLSPVSKGQQYSPYSSYASFAGNEWYISPEILADQGLLERKDLERFEVASSDIINYEKAAIIKQKLLDKAWNSYNKKQDVLLKADFEAFCSNESYWLDDYALYIVLKKHHHNKPWYKWPDEYKSHNKTALKAFGQGQAEAIKKAKWLQFLFNRQLVGLKDYCNALGIQLFGDLPFYVSYDSADVWANRELFSVGKDGSIEYVAGVPPDYFNANGQLWGMPVFNWDKLKAQQFDWWIKRIKKNLEYYDLLRLDHFRAFSSYWAVPASEQTAINGTWVKAPGNELFELLKQELGTLPFVAEDLGDIDDDVYKLRDNFELPGMKVLQFAWGDDMPASPHIPHNYSENFVAYTGTHDNNTTKGWYRQDADKAVHKRLSNYMDEKLEESNVGEVFIKAVLASVADIAIIPLQDWLGFDERARLNTPAGIENNWVWQIVRDTLKQLPEKEMKKWITNYNRL